MSVCLSTIASTISRFLFCTSKSKNGYLVWDSVLYNLTFQTDSEYRGDQTAWIITTSLVFYAVLTTPKWLSLSNTVIESTSLLTSVFVFVFLYEVPSMWCTVICSLMIPVNVHEYVMWFCDAEKCYFWNKRTTWIRFWRHLETYLGYASKYPIV